MLKNSKILWNLPPARPWMPEFWNFWNVLSITVFRELNFLSITVFRAPHAPKTTKA